MGSNNIFKNRTAVLITKHKKEEVIFPVLEPMEMNLKLLDSIDSVTFGTLNGDIYRTGTQLEAEPYQDRFKLNKIFAESVLNKKLWFS